MAFAFDMSVLFAVFMGVFFAFGMRVLFIRSMLVTSAFIKVSGDFAGSILVGMKREAVDDIADERSMPFLKQDLLGAAGSGMIVIALVGVEVTTVVIEGRDGVSC